MPRLSINQIISSRNEYQLESIYHSHGYDRTTQVHTARYTRADFKKLNNILLLLREYNRGQPRTALLNYIEIGDDSVCYRYFGCSLNSLANSLARVCTFVRHHFPLAGTGATPMLVLTPQTRRVRGDNGYVRNTVTSATITFVNCPEFISALDGRSDEDYQPSANRLISNFGRGSSRRNMPTPQITLNQAQINIDVEAIRLDEARELELNDNYQRNLRQLLQSAERESYPQEYELSSSTVGHYITNALNTFANNRFNNLDSTTRRLLNNAAIKFMTNAMNLIMNNNSRPTFPENTLDTTDASLDWRRGIIQGSADRDRYNIGFRLGRSKVEEWLGVGNRGPHQNRSRMSREIREKIRLLNTVFECFGSSISTTKLQNEDDDSFRIFVLTGIPRYGIRFTNGVSPLTVPTVNQSEQMPEFFRNPLIGVDRGISSIFNFLLGRQEEEQSQDRQLVIDEIVTTPIAAPIASERPPRISIEVAGQQVVGRFSEISEMLEHVSNEQNIHSAIAAG